MKLLLINDDGDEYDVTEAVKHLYDLAIGSMDFGSGFWSAEDAAPVARLAKLARFGDWERVESYCSDTLQKEEQDAWIRQTGRNTDMTVWGQWTGNGWATFPHDHVFSSQGKCMWRFCETEGNPDV